MPLEPSISRASSIKPADDPTTNKPGHNFVTCIHIAKLGDILCSITVTWAKTLISHTLYITIESPHDVDNHYTCKIDLKTWQFWGKKGLKSFRFADQNVDVFWDLRSAKFSSSPEPESDYYVAIVACQETILLLGDEKNEALKRTRCRPTLEEACLVQKKEIVFAKRCFCTRTRLGREEHSIMIESDLSGPCEPEMWISVDGRESIRVPNLHWRFRGNETIVVDDVSMQILWDVHDWLYSGSRSGVGIFVCRRGPDRDEGAFNGYHLEVEEFSSRFWDVRPSSMPFSHFIYAWTTES